MEKDHVVIGLDTYESLKKGVDKAVLDKQAAEHTKKILVDAIIALITTGSKSHAFKSIQPSDENIIHLFTEADLRVEFEGLGGTITCGNGKKIIKLKIHE